jgi:glycosyltransferase involved in cell wall biosynthesis
MFYKNRILYIQYTNPTAYPPLQHGSRILARTGCESVFLGVDIDDAERLSFPLHANIRVYKIPACLPGWRQKIHYLQYALWAWLWVLRWRPQWIYASDLLTCPIAYGLSLLPGVRVIYHEHDSFHGTTTGSFFTNLCLKARARLAQRSVACILPNQARLSQFCMQNPDTHAPFCVWNCPALEEVSDPQPDLFEHQDLWLLYHGSIVPDRLPLAVLDSLCLLPRSVKLRVIGYETSGHRGYIAQILARATELGLLKRLEIMEAMPRQELLKWCGKSHIGLALMPLISDDLNMTSMIGASNKPFDYLACGLPLVVADLPDWQAMYVEPGYALACNPEDPESIAAAIGWYLTHPTEMRAMGEQGRQRILADWNYEAQFSVVKSQIFPPLLQDNIPTSGIPLTSVGSDSVKSS